MLGSCRDDLDFQDMRTYTPARTPASRTPSKAGTLRTPCEGHGDLRDRTCEQRRRCRALATEHKTRVGRPDAVFGGGAPSADRVRHEDDRLQPALTQPPLMPPFDRITHAPGLLWVLRFWKGETMGAP